MIKILLVYTDDGLNRKFIESLENKETANVRTASSGGQALDIIRDGSTNLVIAAEKLPDMSGLTLIEKLVMTNPFINTALASRLSEEDFHETTEGLGILMSVPPDANEGFADVLLSYLTKISAPTAS